MLPIILATLITLPYTFTPNTKALSAQVNADFTTVYNVVNGNLDRTNIGSAGIDANQIIPTTVGGATFGGTQSYTFANGLTVTGTLTTGTLSPSSISTTGGISAATLTLTGGATFGSNVTVSGAVYASSVLLNNGFDIVGAPGQSLIVPGSASAPLQFSNAGNTVINTIFADTGGEQLERGNLTLSAGSITSSGAITSGSVVTGSTLNLTTGASLFESGSALGLTGGSTATNGFYFANAANTAVLFTVDNSGDGAFQGNLGTVGALSGNSVSSATSITAGTSITAQGNITGAYGIYTNIADSALSTNDCVQTTGTTLISAPAQCMVSISGGNKTLAITGTVSGFSCAAGVSCTTTLTGSWNYTFSGQPNCQATLESSSNPPLIVRCAATTTGYTVNFYNAGGGAVSNGTEVVDLLATGS